MANKVRAIVLRPDGRWEGQVGQLHYAFGAKYLLVGGKHPHAHTLDRDRVFMKGRPLDCDVKAALTMKPPEPSFDNAERRLLILAGQIVPVLNSPKEDMNAAVQQEIPVAYEQSTQAAFLQSAKAAETQQRIASWGTMLIGLAAVIFSVIAIIAVKMVFWGPKS